MEIRKPFAKILKDIRKKLGKSQKTQEKTQNSRKKLKTQGKNSMSRRIAPLLTSQVMLKKAWSRESAIFIYNVMIAEC